MVTTEEITNFLIESGCTSEEISRYRGRSPRTTIDWSFHNERARAILEKNGHISLELARTLDAYPKKACKASQRAFKRWRIKAGLIKKGERYVLPDKTILYIDNQIAKCKNGMIDLRQKTGTPAYVSSDWQTHGKKYCNSKGFARRGNDDPMILRRD
jgi:hypothetical protein